MGSDFPSEKLQGNKENEDGGGMDSCSWGARRPAQGDRGQDWCSDSGLWPWNLILRYAGVFVDQNNLKKKSRNVC